MIFFTFTFSEISTIAQEYIIYCHYIYMHNLHTRLVALRARLSTECKPVSTADLNQSRVCPQPPFAAVNYPHLVATPASKQSHPDSVLAQY